MMRPRVLSLVALLGIASVALGQGVPIVVGNQGVGGVYIDANGIVHSRQMDTKDELAAQKLRAKILTAGAPKSQPMTYVSLAGLVEQMKASKDLSDEVKYLSGLTQLKYVFVFPEDKDIVLAGISEPFEVSNKSQPTGKITGRPVLQLDDLIVAFRVAQGRAEPFGCSIDPAPGSFERSNQVMQQFANAARGARMNAMKEALGPQDVRMFGAPADTRFAFVTLAADYKLKRLCLGMDPMPVGGIGSPFDSSRAATARFWFEANYAPLLVSAEEDAYEIRGPRLTLKAGALLFDEKGATETAKAFARKFTDKIPQLCATVPVFADLQNVADLALVAALIREDKLTEKSGLDLSYLMSPENHKVANLPTPRNAETLVNFQSGSIVAGGVSFDMRSVTRSSNREKDSAGALKTGKTRPEKGKWSKTKGD